MRKYRVKQKGDYYYPQKRLFGFLFWIYYYNTILGTFSYYNVIYQCNTLKEAWSYIYSKNKISVKKYHYEE